MRIWKYELYVDDFQTIIIPRGAQFLTVQTQGEAETPCLWILCDENAEKEKRRIAMYGTGHPLPNVVGKYITSFQQSRGKLIFHVFDITGIDQTVLNSRS